MPDPTRAARCAVQPVGPFADSLDAVSIEPLFGVVLGAARPFPADALQHDAYVPFGANASLRVRDATVSNRK